MSELTDTVKDKLDTIYGVDKVEKTSEDRLKVYIGDGVGYTTVGSAVFRMEDGFSLELVEQDDSYLVVEVSEH
jgi:hypothetical protein